MNKIFYILERLFGILKRFFKTSQIIGFDQALKLFSIDKFSKRDYYTLNLKNFNQKIYLRPRTSDSGTFSSIFIDKSYPDFKGFEAKTIIDAGANVGFATIYYILEFPKAQIVAIEPDISNIEMLKMNTSSIQNLDILNGALWCKQEKLSIVNIGANKDSFQVGVDGCSQRSFVASYTIHDIVKSKSWSSIDILKIDIEGAEKDIFEQSYSLWLDLVKILIIELHEDYRPGCGEAVFKAIVGRGFQYYRRGENYIFVRSNLGLKISP